MNVRHLAGICVVAVVLSGCLGRLIADKGMSEDDRRECASLITPVKTRFGLSEFRIPPGLNGVIGTKAHEGQFPRDDPYPHNEPPSVGCSTEVRGPLRSLYTVVEIWRVVDQQQQTAIVQTIQEQRRGLAHPKPTIIRFTERELWVVHRSINGEAFGYGRGKERLLRDFTVR